MDLPKIKVPLILGIWGGKGQVSSAASRGCTTRCAAPAVPSPPFLHPVGAAAWLCQPLGVVTTRLTSSCAPPPAG